MGRAFTTPEHAGMFQPLPDNGFAAGFDNPRTDKVAGLPEGLVGHPNPVSLKVGDLFFGEFAGLRAGWQVGFGLSDDLSDPVLEQCLAPLAITFLGQGRTFAI